MTLDEFLLLVRQHEPGWHLDENGAITANDDDACPIHRVYDEQECGDAIDYWEKGLALGMSSRLVGQIVHAADGKTHGKTRRALLQACNLVEA